MWSVLFPGQGSQHPGMGQFLSAEFKVASRVFDEASESIHMDLKKLCFTGSKEELELTKNTQPAIVTTSIAAYSVLREEFGFQPALGAGHSVGEYSAMVAAGAMSLSDAVRSVRVRGEAMQAAVPEGEGGMTAIVGPSSEQVKHLCDWVQRESGLGPVEPANFNAPDQTVISGQLKALQWLSQEFEKAPPDFLKGQRVRMIPLKVSAPFHCRLMGPAEEKMRMQLSGIQFSAPKFPIVQNVTALDVTDPVVLRENLIHQVTGSVRWVESVQKMSEMGAVRSIECGSGKVLAGLSKKIIPQGFATFNITSLEELKKLEQELKVS